MALNPIAFTEPVIDDFLRCQFPSNPPPPALTPSASPSPTTPHLQPQIMVASGEDDR